MADASQPSISDSVRLSLWRLSIVIATLTIVASVIYGALLIDLVFFLSGAADLLGMPEAIQWRTVVIMFMIIGVCGIVVPVGYVRLAWSRAFPNRPAA